MTTTTRPVLRVGCPMWAHPAWIGRYLAPGRRALADYATWCNAVEGNTTFYAEPSPTTVDRWCELAPADFRFAFKVPRTITHERRLEPSAHRLAASFLRVLRPLGDRVGPVQLQLPPSFGPDRTDDLARFVAALPTSHRWVVELRHPAFFDGGPAQRVVDEILAAADVGRVVLDTRPLYAQPVGSRASQEERRTKPRLPLLTDVMTTDVMGPEPVVRVIGGDDPDATFEGVSAWVPAIVTWLSEGRRPYVFVHQPENRESPTIARRLHDAVRAELPDLAPLPEPNDVTNRDGQTALF